jgi:ferredoxin--NADP+ reductase
VIGTNKPCAQETARALIEDALHGLLPQPPGSPTDFDRLLSSRSLPVLHAVDWEVLRRHEEDAGKASGRPRVKIVSREGAVDVVRRGKPV